MEKHRRIKIAACQGVWTTDIDANLKKMKAFIRGIRIDIGESVKLISFTEYAVHGAGDVSRNLDDIAEPVPGPTTDKICKMAASYKCWICNGSMLEKRHGALYNTALLISPEGEIAMRYHKTHPWCEPAGKEAARPGKEFPVCDVPGIGKVGIMICSDGFFPEVARTLAFNGAELILWPTAAFHPLLEPSRAIAVSRALENNCYVMAIMGAGFCGGLGYIGHSMIVNPDGVILSEAGDGETILIDTVDMGYVSLARTEGGKGLMPSFRFLKIFKHKYAPYVDIDGGAVFDQIEES